MKKNYQILYKGIYSNKLCLMETDEFKIFKKSIDEFKRGEYNGLLLIDTNVYER